MFCPYGIGGGTNIPNTYIIFLMSKVLLATPKFELFSVSYSFLLIVMPIFQMFFIFFIFKHIGPNALTNIFLLSITRILAVPISEVFLQGNFIF